MNQVKMLDVDQHFYYKFITMLVLLCSVGAVPSTDPPICPNFPFNFMWNAPTDDCGVKFQRPLDLSYFCSVTQNTFEFKKLWKDSSVQFPSIFLDFSISNPLQARMNVRRNIKDVIFNPIHANSSYSPPVYAFIRPVYKNKIQEYMSKVRHTCHATERHSFL